MSVIQSIKCEGVNWFKDFPYISAKTGTGKTTTAVLELRDYLEEHNNLKIDKVILLTPYKRTRKQVLADSRFAGNVKYLDYNLLRSSAFQSRIEETIVSTYAGLCNALKDDLITLDGCLLIFDELHTFLDFTRYQPQMSYLLEWILTPELWERFIAVGMTGTPKILEYCDSIPLNFKNITPTVEMNLTCESGLFINGGSAKSYAELLILRGFDGAKLFYVESAKECYKIAQMFNNEGYSAAFVVSSYHEKHSDENGIPLNESMETQVFDGLSIVDWLDEKSDVPANLNVLVINASAKDGINIIDKEFRFDEAIIESANRATIEQARSRIRHDLPQLTVIYNRKNKERSFDNLKESIAFFELYESTNNQDELKEIMLERLSKQIAVSGNTSSSKKLDCIVMKGKSLFVNPFIKALTHYDLENYEFSKTRTYYDDSGNEIVEETEITFAGKTLSSFEEWISELKPLIGEKNFSIQQGSKIREEINNAPKLKELISNNLQLGVWYDVDQLREMAKEMNLRNDNGDLMGYEYLVSQLEKIYHKEKKKKQIKGVRKWRYCFSKK